MSENRLNNIFKKDLYNAIDEIANVIAYAKAQEPGVIIRYTPEDTVRSKFTNVLDVSVAAVQAGADIISIADTTGFMIPGTARSMFRYVRKLKNELAKRDLYPQIAVHCHNDRGFALANALDGFRAGANIIDASVLGLGERAGIVDLAQLLSLFSEINSEDKRWNLKKLLELYELVSFHSGIPVPVHFPVIGKNAFTHCAGIHTHAATQNPIHYQSLNPKKFGRNMRISLDHMSGISSVQWALEKIALKFDKHMAFQVLDVVKSIGKKGKTVGINELPYIVQWCEEPPDGKHNYSKLS